MEVRAGKSPFSRAHFDPDMFTVKLLSSNPASPKIQMQFFSTQENKKLHRKPRTGSPLSAEETKEKII